MPAPANSRLPTESVPTALTPTALAARSATVSEPMEPTPPTEPCVSVTGTERAVELFRTKAAFAPSTVSALLPLTPAEPVRRKVPAFTTVAPE